MNTPQANPDPQQDFKNPPEIPLRPKIRSLAKNEEPEMTTEVADYFSDSIHKLQEKMIAGTATPADWDYNKEVETWKAMPKHWKKRLTSIEAMKKEAEEASKRHISLKQWLGLLDLAQHVGEKKRIRWIDKTFRFPGEGRITAQRSLHFGEGKITIPLPEGLEIEGEPPLIKESVDKHSETENTRKKLKEKIFSQGQESN